MRAIWLLLMFVMLTAATASHAQPEAKQKCIYAPLPEYPLEARARSLGGSGMFVLHLDQKKGAVRSVTVEKSTGAAVLDNAAITCLKRWRFIKNINVATVKVPFTFTATGVID